MTNTNGERGKRWEREVVAVLRTHGHPYAERTLRAGAHDDRGDVSGVVGFYLDCKDCGRLEIPRWLDEVREEARIASARSRGFDLVPVVVVKRRGAAPERAYVILELARFAEVIE
jgi:hypothetical protein